MRFIISNFQPTKIRCLWVDQIRLQAVNQITSINYQKCKLKTQTKEIETGKKCPEVTDTIEKHVLDTNAGKQS